MGRIEIIGLLIAFSAALFLVYGWYRERYPWKCPKCKERNTHRVEEMYDPFNGTVYDECSDCGALW